MGHDFLQLPEAAVKEVFTARNDDHRQGLRSRPIQHGLERHHVVLIAVNDERVFGQRIRIEASDCRCDQGQALRGQPAHDQRLHVGTERKSSEQERDSTEAVAHLLGDEDEIIGFAHALVVNSFGSAHAAEIRTHGAVAEREECARQRGDDFVVARAAVLWMGMGDKSDAAPLWARIVYCDVDGPDGAIDR